MKMIPLVGGAATGVGTYIALSKKTNLSLPIKAGISIVAAGAGWWGTKKVSGLIAGSPSKDNVDLAKTEQQEILKNNLHLPAGQQVKASYTKQEMQNYANSLERAMSGAGTDDDKITEVMSAMNNDLDILNLIEAFGIRDDDDLSTWLDDDGATGTANKVLETKGNISKRF